MTLYYQNQFTLTEVPPDAGYLHAQFRQQSPLQQKGTYTIVDDIRGAGQYVGTYLAWEVHSSGLVGEGEIKFFLDGTRNFQRFAARDRRLFLRSYNFENHDTKKYQVFTTPYTGLAQVLPPDKTYEVGQKFGLYRWHIADPVRFDKRPEGNHPGAGLAKRRTLSAIRRQHCLSGYWYQKEPHRKFPPLPSEP